MKESPPILGSLQGRDRLELGDDRFSFTEKTCILDGSCQLIRQCLHNFNVGIAEGLLLFRLKVEGTHHPITCYQWQYQFGPGF